MLQEHLVNGCVKELLVHRKGSTRAFPPHHPLTPVAFQSIGQPVLIGGTMGSSSYILLGTSLSMSLTWGSTCHGSGRAKSRNSSRNSLAFSEVIQKLQDKHISVRYTSTNSSLSCFSCS